MFAKMSVIDYIYARRLMSLSLNLNILTAKESALKKIKEEIFLLESCIT